MAKENYTPEEKKVIFSKFALPKVLKRMGLEQDECIIEGEALDAVIERCSGTPDWYFPALTW